MFLLQLVEHAEAILHDLLPSRIELNLLKQP